MGVCITLARLLCLSTLAAASSRDCSLINVNDTLVSTCELQTPSSECATLSTEVAALSAKVQEHIASTAALHEKLDQLLLALNPPVPPSSPPLPPSPPPFHTSCTTVPASGVYHLSGGITTYCEITNSEAYAKVLGWPAPSYTPTSGAIGTMTSHTDQAQKLSDAHIALLRMAAFTRDNGKSVFRMSSTDSRVSENLWISTSNAWNDLYGSWGLTGCTDASCSGSASGMTGQVRSQLLSYASLDAGAWHSGQSGCARPWIDCHYSHSNTGDSANRFRLGHQEFDCLEDPGQRCVEAYPPSGYTRLPIDVFLYIGRKV